MAVRVTARGSRCFELCMRGACVLLDFDAGQTAFLDYEPLLATTPSSLREAFEQVNGRWVIKGEPQHELPQIEGLELGSVDAVLVSSADAMLALPFLTEYSHFRGTVYATSATVQLGRHLMLELVTLPALAKERLPTGMRAPAAAAAPAPPPPEVASALWELSARSRLPYTSNDVEKCLERIVTVSFGEVLKLSESIDAVPFPCASHAPAHSGQLHLLIVLDIRTDHKTLAHICGARPPL